MRVKALKLDQKSSNFNFERVRNRWKEMLDLNSRASEVRGCNPEAGLATVEGKRVNLCSLSVCFSRHGSCVWEVNTKISCNMQLEVVRTRKMFSAIMSHIKTFSFLRVPNFCKSFSELIGKIT